SVRGARAAPAARADGSVEREVRDVPRPRLRGGSAPESRAAAHATRRRPMPDTASERIRVEAPAARCYDVAVDFESYPEWVRDVKEAKILEFDEERRGGGGGGGGGGG